MGRVEDRAGDRDTQTRTYTQQRPEHPLPNSPTHPHTHTQTTNTHHPRPPQNPTHSPPTHTHTCTPICMRAFCRFMSRQAMRAGAILRASIHGRADSSRSSSDQRLDACLLLCWDCRRLHCQPAAQLCAASICTDPHSLTDALNQHSLFCARVLSTAHERAPLLPSPYSTPSTPDPPSTPDSPRRHALCCARAVDGIPLDELTLQGGLPGRLEHVDGTHRVAHAASLQQRQQHGTRPRTRARACELWPCAAWCCP